MKQALLAEIVKKRIKDQMLEVNTTAVAASMGLKPYTTFMSTFFENTGEKFSKIYMTKNFVILKGGSGKFYFYDKIPEEYSNIVIKGREKL